MDRRYNLPPQAYEELVRSQFRNLVWESASLISLGQALGTIDRSSEIVIGDRFAGPVKYLADKSKFSEHSVRSMVESMAEVVNDSFDRIYRGIAVYSETH